MPKPAIVLGIHCASAAKKVALCAARSSSKGLEVLSIHTGRDEQMADAILGWMGGEHPTLLALDTPLGWPADLTSVLSSHQAGLPLRLKPSSLFFRECDRMLKRRFDISSKPIGADKIALNSYATLTFLDHIGYKHGMRIAMAWDQFLQFPAQTIEVSPQATLKALNLPSTKLSGTDTESSDNRNAVLQGIGEQLQLGDFYQQLLDNPQLLLAAVNALTAHQFLYEPMIAPIDIHTAKKEGWIWVRDTKSAVDTTE